ncbi:MAG: hypothetical protein NXI00_22855, partial [Cytophagales bacterium]|nr:hypothetical protein [Cytophagales bacterium]
MDRIIHQKEMKVHHLIKDKVKGKKLEDLLCQEEVTLGITPLVDTLFKAWQDCAPGDPAYC